MARTRQPPSDGPPGLGGALANNETPVPIPVDRTTAGKQELYPLYPDTGEETQRREPPWSGRGEPGHAQSAFSDAEKEIRQQGERLEALWTEFLDRNAVIEQISAQLRILEQAVTQVAQSMPLLEQCKNAIIMLEQRVNALAQQVLHINTRTTAAQLAVQSKPAHESSDKSVEHAERWYQFLMRDLIAKPTPPVPPEEPKQPDGLDPEGTTQH